MRDDIYESPYIPHGHLNYALDGCECDRCLLIRNGDEEYERQKSIVKAARIEKACDDSWEKSR